MSEDTDNVCDILDALDDLAESEDDVTVGDVAEAFGGRGFGPLILLPALLVLTPLGGIPGFPTLMAVIAALLAAQLVLQRDHLWLPSILRQRAVEDERVKTSVEKLRPLGRLLDEHLGSRLEVMVQTPMPSFAGGAVIALCLFVPPSEIIPFAALIPMGAVALLALALTLRDGLVMIVGLAASVAALWAIWTWVL